MVSASDRVTYGPRKLPMDRLSYERLRSENMMVRSTKFGAEKSDITLLQGIGGAAASAGTHSTGGCYDTTDFNHANRQLVGRLLGGADWYRPYNWDNARGGAHVHHNTIGVGYEAASGRAQWTSYYAGKNGLRNNAKDTGPRLITKPLFIAPWTDRGARGVVYLKQGYTARAEGSTKAKSLGAIPVNAKFTVVARVNVGGTIWAINKDGKHVPASVLSKTKVTTATPPTLTDEDRTFWVTKDGKWGTSGYKGANRYERKAGYHLHTVKDATLDGKVVAYVTSSGTWYTPTDLTPAAPIVKRSTVYEVTANPSLLGLAWPAHGATQVKSAKTGAKITGQAETTVDKEVWVQNTENLWWSAKYLSEPSEGPKGTLRIGSLNFPDKAKITVGPEAPRITKAVEQINAADLDVLVTQELVGRTGKDKGSALSLALLKALGSDWEMLVPTTDWNENYILYRPKRVSMLEHFDDTIIRGTLGGAAIGGRHLSAAKFDTDLGEIVIGDTQIVNGNRPAAEVQARLIGAALAKQGTTRVVLGDFNTSGPLAGFTSNGLHDSRTLTAKLEGAKYASYTNQKSARPSTNLDWLIDGAWISGDLKVNEWEIVWGLDDKGNYTLPRVSDHALLIVELTK